MAVFGPVKNIILLRKECGLAMLESAFGVLAATSPAFQSRLIRACVFCSSADLKITVDEAELLRAVADSLGCPMPPVLPGLLTEAVKQPSA